MSTPPAPLPEPALLPQPALLSQPAPLPAEDTDAPFDPEQIPDHCVLAHHVFRLLPNISFKRAESDGTPVMVVPFGDRTASVPLRSLQREFAIRDDSADGHMLGLIAESLDYVTALRLGDKLPDEVVNGKASWEPGILHRRRAATRLRLRLLAWLDPNAARSAGRGDDSANRLDSDPELRTMVQNAFRKAAAELNLQSPEELVVRVEQLAEEFSYIEALRERLLVRVQTLVARGARLGAQLGRSDGRRADALSRMQCLADIALTLFHARFDDIDAQTGEIIALLRNPDSQISFVRSNRDSLYRTMRGWDPILTQWDEECGEDDNAVWILVADTYQFLAKRHLPASEWPSFSSLRQAVSKGSRKGMSW